MQLATDKWEDSHGLGAVRVGDSVEKTVKPMLEDKVTFYYDHEDPI